MKRVGMLAAGVVCMSVLAACESEQKETFVAPARGSQQSTAKQAMKPSGGSSQVSRPLTKSAPSYGSNGTAVGKPGPKQTAAAEATPPARDKPLAGLPAPTYAEIAKSYNDRTSRLQRIWARAVVSVDFTDEDGNHRWEQGEGHFQVVQPSKMALSAGKLSEVMLWIGCDGDRYWFIDAKEKHSAWIGRHSAATREKIESLGMPAAPRDLLALAGVTPLPKPSNEKRRDPTVRWSDDKRTLIFDIDRVGAAGARWRYYLNPKTYEPSRIEMVEPSTGEAVLSATLENYANLTVKGDNSIPPRIASRVRCLHHPSGSTLGLSIADITNGGANRLRAENFDFDALRDLLGIHEVIDLDVPRESRRPTETMKDSDQE